MNTVNVTLEEVLRARDIRAARQRRLLAAHGMPLVSFTMNMAGPVKVTPLSALAFDAGLARLYDTLGRPAAEEVLRARTGWEALLVYDRPAAELKAACLALEAAAPVGRLYDLDVLDLSGEKLCRPLPRTCIVCGGPAMVCSRSRAHGLEAVAGRTHEILADFAAEHLSLLAADALEREVRLTPKPGLVDQRNNGAHDDMDLPLFLRSIRVLTPYFRQMTALGLAGAPAIRLQALGVEAEAAMLRATGGVNTHRGALFSFSVLLSALGQCLVSGGEVFSRAACLSAHLTPPRNTHGTAVAARYRTGGARGEALAGFPTAKKAADLLETRDPLTVLLWLMAHTEDSNLYYRGGAEGAAFVKARAAQLLAAPPEQRAALTRALDEALIARRLSPGGCADLLALALFLARCRRIPALSDFCGQNTCNPAADSV